MPNRHVKWIFYTVLVGLIPVFARLLVWLVDQSKNVPKFDASDFIVFGLIVHISIINEIEHFNRGHQSWKTIHNGSSVLFIVMYTVLFACQILGKTHSGLFDQAAILNVAWVLAIVSFVIGLSVFYRLSRLVPSCGR